LEIIVDCTEKTGFLDNEYEKSPTLYMKNHLFLGEHLEKPGFWACFLPLNEHVEPFLSRVIVSREKIAVLPRFGGFNYE